MGTRKCSLMGEHETNLWGLGRKSCGRRLGLSISQHQSRCSRIAKCVGADAVGGLVESIRSRDGKGEKGQVFGPRASPH